MERCEPARSQVIQRVVLRDDRATRLDERTWAEGAEGAEPPEVPGFRTWRGVYLLVFGWFVLVVILLTLFTRLFS